MLTVELRLPVLFVVALVGALVAIPSASLAIYIASQGYGDELRLKVWSCVTAGFLYLGAGSALIIGIRPYCGWCWGFHALAAGGAAICGLGLICCRLKYAVTAQASMYIDMELAMFVLWVVYVAISAALTSAAAIYWETSINKFRAEQPCVPKSHPSMSTISVPDHRPKHGHSTFNGGSLNNSSLSPVSLHDPESLWSPISPGLHIENSGVPPQLKAASSLGQLVSIKRKNRAAPPKKSPRVPSLTGLDAVPEGFADMDWDVPGGDANDAIRWILNHADQSRIPSDSTNRSASIFSATDYNRRINEAGFVKDEPEPVKAKIKSKASFSHYDQERMRQLAGQ